MEIGLLLPLIGDWKPNSEIERVREEFYAPLLHHPGSIYLNEEGKISKQILTGPNRKT